MSCLNDIVTLGLCPDEAASLSGFRLIDAPGISIKNLANTATETYTSGVNLAMAKKSLALLQVKNDFIGALQANSVVTTISQPVYDTSVFNTNEDLGVYAGERGINLYKSHWKGGLRATYIKAIQVYPFASGEGEIIITDGYKQYTYPVEFVSGEVNTFDENTLSGFPFEVESNCAEVRIDNTTIHFSVADITCKTGCGGSAPNPCGYADGYNGTSFVRAEGYGINLQFYCECNYGQILCDLAKGFSGELIWLKWQIAIFEEALKSNRFNNWIIYGHEEIKKETLPDLYGKYNAKWNDLMSGMMGILKTYRDDCLNCQGLRWVTNV